MGIMVLSLVMAYIAQYKAKWYKTPNLAMCYISHSVLFCTVLVISASDLMLIYHILVLGNIKKSRQYGIVKYLGIMVWSLLQISLVFVDLQLFLHLITSTFTLNVK